MRLDRLDIESFISATSDYRTSIMGFSMLAIMLFHQYFTSVFPFNFFHNYGYWGVDVFLFLSGVGLVYSMKKNSTKIFYLRRLLRIFPSCILCGTSRYFIIILLGSFSLMLREKLNYNVWTLASLDLWFIHTIMILYIISPFLYHCLNKWPLFSMSCIVLLFFLNGLYIKPLVGFDWFSPIGIFSWTVERLLVFSIGMYFSINKYRINVNVLFPLLFLLFAVCLVLIEKADKAFFGLQTFMYFSLALGMPALIFLIMSILKKIPSIFQYPFLFLGSYSLELYLVHEFIFWVLKVSFGNGNPWILLPLGFILSCISAYLCKSCVSKWKLN